MVENCYRLVEMMPDGVCQGADGVVEDEQVLVLIFPECKHQSVQNETEIWNQLRARLLLQSRKCTEKTLQSDFITPELFCSKYSSIFSIISNTPAGGLLDPLVTIQDALEEFCHERFEVCVRRLAHHPVCVAAECPAGDGANQSLLITQTLDQVRDELRQVRYHSLHTA